MFNGSCGLQNKANYSLLICYCKTLHFIVRAFSHLNRHFIGEYLIKPKHENEILFVQETHNVEGSKAEIPNSYKNMKGKCEELVKVGVFSFISLSNSDGCDIYGT